MHKAQTHAQSTDACSVAEGGGSTYAACLNWDLKTNVASETCFPQPPNLPSEPALRTCPPNLPSEPALRTCPQEKNISKRESWHRFKKTRRAGLKKKTLNAVKVVTVVGLLVAVQGWWRPAGMDVLWSDFIICDVMTGQCVNKRVRYIFWI